MKAIAASALLLTAGAHAAITDFTNWTLVQDPPNANFSAAATMSDAMLFADGPVPLATDIGFQSVNGPTAATSTAGYAFDPASSFSIAVDYDLSFNGPAAGFLSLGFGVGVDGAGMNSAGAGMTTSNGAPLLTFGAAARVNDVDQGAMALALNATLAGSLFVSYDAPSGDVTIGAAQTPGAGAAASSATYSGIQNMWPAGDLLASFFIRSGPGGAWTSGDATATFDNFRIIEGEAKNIPSPGSLGAVLIGCGALGARRRR